MGRKKSDQLITRSYVIDKTIDTFLDKEVKENDNMVTKSSIVRTGMHFYIKMKDQ